MKYDPTRRWSRNEPDDVCETCGAKVEMFCRAHPEAAVVSGAGSVIIETEAEILAFYWPYWSKQMQRVHPGRAGLLSAENCIEDYVTVHWAWETDKVREG